MIERKIIKCRKVINPKQAHKPYHTPKRRTEKQIQKMLKLAIKSCGRTPANAWKPFGYNPMRDPKYKQKQMQSKALTIKLRRLERKHLYYSPSASEMAGPRANVIKSA